MVTAVLPVSMSATDMVRFKGRQAGGLQVLQVFAYWAFARSQYRYSGLA